jgi:membrane associated rhomboid family serine protease
MWLLTEFAGSSESSYTLAQFGANVPGLIKSGEWWRLISSVFLHVGLLHLFFNLYALYLFGAFVERLAGRWEMFVIFMVAGISGSAASTWLGHAEISAGASGAIFGLIGAAIVMAITFPSIQKDVRKVYVINFIFIAALQLVYGFVEPHIDNFAHMGGLAGGVLVGLLLHPPGFEGRRKTAFRVAATFLALVAAVSLFDVIRNVKGAGYPMKPLPLATREDPTPQHGWSVRVPGFWIPFARTERNGEPYMEYEDPLGAGLLIRPAPGIPVKLGPEPGEEAVPHGERLVILGKNLYHELQVTATEGDEHIAVARFLFQKLQPGDSYELVFQCELRDADAYQELLKQILTSFEVHARPPVKKPIPAKPFRPQGPVAQVRTATDERRSTSSLITHTS